jgi:hypothetical protein
MRRKVIFFASAGLLALAPSTATAHFYIDYPDASVYPGPSPVPWWHEDSAGSPQKLGPCGDEDDATDAGGGPTGVVTPFVAGQTITIQWTEVVSHTGWYRIALATARNQFVDPPVAVDSSGNSADAGIESPPVFPVLADGIYKHAAGSAPMTWPPYSLTLPNMTCTKCTIQVIQVMLDHPSNLGNLPDGAPNPDGFLYHHCIDISLRAADGGGGEQTGTDSGTTSSESSSVTTGSTRASGSTASGSTAANSATSSGAGSGAGSGTDSATTEGPQSSSSGCGCTVVGAPPWAGAAALLALVPLARMRAARRKNRL